MAVADEADAHAAEDALHAGRGNTRFHHRRAQCQQTAGRDTGHSNAVGIHQRICEDMVEQDALVGEEQAIPAMSLQAQ